MISIFSVVMSFRLFWIDSRIGDADGKTCDNWDIHFIKSIFVFGFKEPEYINLCPKVYLNLFIKRDFVKIKILIINELKYFFYYILVLSQSIYL